MGKNIDWEKIKDGFRGFEKLAVKFINSKYKNVSWENTPPTRDGNTDAVAIIIGYQSHENDPAQWWMEAKYSTTSKLLTRYRIDSTVVSAILEGNVEKVVFVTNIEIDAKTITDITRALRCTSRCKDVEFYTKYSLEYWLLMHTDIYNDFFLHEHSALSILPDDFIISQEIAYYNPVSNLMVFNEPLRELIIGKEYIAYIGVFASKDTTVSIHASNKLKGIRFLTKTKDLPISKGENTLCFQFLLKENYGYKNSKRKDIPMPIFKIKNINLTPNQHITVLHQNTSMIELESQENIMECLKEDYANYSAESNPCIITLKGKSDVGKTKILDKFLAKISTNNPIIFYHEFYESVKENVRILLNLLIYILFPYVPPETIDEAYVDSIKNTEIKILLRDFIKYKEDHENILKYLTDLLGYPALLPNKVSINRRIIVLDNLQLLDKKSAFFVAKIVCEIYEKKLPVFFLLCGQPSYFDSRSYNYLCEHCVFHPLKLELGAEDILKNCNIICDEKYDLSKLNIFNMDAVSLLLFQKYLMSENKKISNLQELIIALRIFWISDIVECHILNQFKTILKKNNMFRTLLDKIYWSCQPINVAEISEYVTELHYLLENNLVKYNTNGEIVTSYSLYQVYYRKHYLPVYENLNYEQNSPEDLRIKFLTLIDIHTLNRCIEQVKTLFEAKSYFKLDYILKDVFKSDKHLALKNMLNAYEYHWLYYIYAYAAHQNGETDECEIIFQEIQYETNVSYDKELLLLSLKCLWELGVIAYENMQYASVIEKEKEAVSLIEKIKRVDDKKCGLCQYINYHDFRVLEAMIKRESDYSKDEELYYKYLSDMEEFGFHYRALSFSARYALTLCCTNIELCIQMLYNTGQIILDKYGEEDKHYQWCMFYYYFYRMIWEHNHCLFQEVIFFHEKMRLNQYGNYRKKLYAMAAYLYSIGDISSGNQYLFQDTIFPYEARRRYQAFYYETLALHEAINDKIPDAIIYLDNAISLLEPIESYSAIPIHNKKLLADKLFSASKICFYVSEKMDGSIYYIDPRSAW